MFFSLVFDKHRQNNLSFLHVGITARFHTREQFLSFWDINDTMEVEDLFKQVVLTKTL